MDRFSLYDLERRVAERAEASVEVSYTRKLLDRGVAQCAKKLGEEAVELALAAVTETRQRLIESPPICFFTCSSSSRRATSAVRRRSRACRAYRPVRPRRARIAQRRLSGMRSAWKRPPLGWL